jgi:hypothetical protein
MAMFAILYALGMAVANLVMSRVRLEAEIFLLRHHLNLALRHAPPLVPEQRHAMTTTEASEIRTLGQWRTPSFDRPKRLHILLSFQLDRL